MFLKKETDKYMVPNIFRGETISFTFHPTWKEANKHAKQRRVQMFHIEKEQTNNKEYNQKLLKALTPFLITLKDRYRKFRK